MIFGVLLIVTSLILIDMLDRLNSGSGIPEVRARQGDLRVFVLLLEIPLRAGCWHQLHI
jgi:hypothetical protein